MQTSYAATMPVAFAGMIADNRDTVTESGVLEGTAIPFGLALTRGTADPQVKVPAALSAKLQGVARHTHAQYNQDLSGTAGIPAKGDVNVLRRGVIWVRVEENVAAEDAAYFRVTANGGNTQLGGWRKSVDNNGSADTAVLAPGCVFRSAATAGNLAKLEINLP